MFLMGKHTAMCAGRVLVLLSILLLLLLLLTPATEDVEMFMRLGGSFRLPNGREPQPSWRHTCSHGTSRY